MRSENHPAVLLNSSYFVLLGQSGSTSQRPTYPKAGAVFINTDVDVATWFDGAIWRQATGEAADTVSAAASWETSSETITLSATAPTWITEGMSVYDVTLGDAVGTVSSVSGTTVALTADASHASSGSSDLLLFY